MNNNDNNKEQDGRLAYLRQQIETEQISTSEIVELQGLADYIDRSDVLLLEWAGVPEYEETEQATIKTEQATIDRFKARNIAAGEHFFDYEAIEFFNSFIYPDVIYNTLFVTSEQRPGSDEPRLFTIRRAVNGGERIETVGVFQGYETLEAAKLAAYTLQACNECGIDVFDGEVFWRDKEHSNDEYSGSDGDPYCEDHASNLPEFYVSKSRR